ncbi:MAG: YhcH/YjgK/YiaL family protein [Bacteroidales bacterium]|jgi:YhcH/YjgK/YiaL family protein|nr:YhcH/YjgK/YiaL family protein [Bacteroidales bacterium]
MIVSSLDCSERYESLHPLFKQAFDFLKTTDSFTDCGKTVLTEAKSHVTISKQPAKGYGKTKLETHNRYIDIQMVLDGEELIACERREMCFSEGEYDAEKDITFYNDDCSFYVRLHPREFVIFFPEDAHAPLSGEDLGLIKKAVVKILI